MTPLRPLPFVTLLLLLMGPARAQSADEPLWPQFRGPDGQGHVDSTSAPRAWGEEQRVLWKTPLPGKGWSSPVVVGDHVWCTAGVTHGEPRPPKDKSTIAETFVYDEVRLLALCVSRTTGRLIHRVELFRLSDAAQIHPLNSHASPSPCVFEDRVYCHFGSNGTACVDARDGSVLWRKKFDADYYVGAGSSPVICEGLLVLTCDGADQQYVVALNPQTGETVWRKPRPPITSTNPDYRKSYCTPLAVTVAGRRELIIPGAQWIVAYRPEDGEELWRMDHGKGFSLVARPVTDGRFLYFCTGFGSKRVVAVRLGGSGDLGEEHLAWSWKKSAPNQPSPLLHNDRLFLVDDQGVAQCLDALTGKSLWRKRLGGNFSASVMRVGDAYYFFSREGVATILDADGAELGQNRLEGGFMATPAIVENQWIVRTETHLYGIGNKSVAMGDGAAGRR